MLSDDEIFADDALMAINANVGFPMSQLGPIVRAIEAAVLAKLESGGVLVRLDRPEGYEDVHPELVVEDAINENWPLYEVLTKGETP